MDIAHMSSDLGNTEPSVGSLPLNVAQTTISKSSVEGNGVMPNGCVRILPNNDKSYKDNDYRDVDQCCKTSDLCKDKTSECVNQSLLVDSASGCGDDHEHKLKDDIEELTSCISNTKVTDEVITEAGQSSTDEECGIRYAVYVSELQMPDIIRLITKDLSEPYSIYTYRYFIHNWPKLCYLAYDQERCVGSIVCKLDMNKKMVRRGYIAMLAVDKDYRRRKIGSNLVLKAIRAMVADDCDEVVLETEITNKAALRLYENLGFVRDKRLFRYYLNGVDALRLKLWLS